jgi:putative transferase (TIGR04331 family)
MVKHLLVTTALEETRLTNEQNVFLGEWCKNYDQKNYWQSLSYKIVDYHWDDRNKLKSDYQYIALLYERLLLDLSNALNLYHKTNHSNRYWRILVGPWLGYFTQILFDRWEMIEKAFLKYSITDTIILHQNKEEFIPNTMEDFLRMIVDDKWNHLIFSSILENNNYKGLKVEYKSFEKGYENIDEVRPSLILNLLSNLTKCFDRIFKPKYFFYKTSLKFKENTELQIKLRQFPQFRFSKKLIKTKYQLANRLKLEIEKSYNNRFESFLYDVVRLHLPKAYLEGYKDNYNFVLSSNSKFCPAAIFTSIGVTSDDFFKFWVSSQIEKGSKLVIGQHGGHYGTGLFSFNEDHDLAISDKYLSWGWLKSNYPNIEPIGILIIDEKFLYKTNQRKKEKILLITNAYSRYSNWLYSSIISSQIKYYAEDQIKFIERLKSTLRNKLLVRLYHPDYNLSLKNRINDRISNIKFEDGLVSIYELISNSRVVISTYNATSFLETLALNVPTVVYWDDRFWEIRDSAKYFFDKLKSVGILHETPDSAADFINSNWYNIETWWYSKELQFIRKEFCNEFAKLNINKISNIKNVLKNISNDFNK